MTPSAVVHGARGGAAVANLGDRFGLALNCCGALRCIVAAARLSSRVAGSPAGGMGA